MVHTDRQINKRDRNITKHHAVSDTGKTVLLKMYGAELMSPM